MSELSRSINPNTADLEELTLLPGVGAALAQRIIDHRPFDSLDDLRRVPGLGRSTFEKLQAMIDLEALQVEPEKTGEESKPALEADAPEKPVAPHRGDQQPFATRSQVLGISAAAAGVGVLISILLMLSILIGINRTLNYSRHAAIRDLTAGVSQIEAQLVEINTNMEGVENRLRALQGLSGRMTELEGETADIASEVEAASARVQQMRTRLEEVSLQIEELAQQTDHQATFFDRLQQLLNEIFGGVVEENVQ